MVKVGINRRPGAVAVETAVVLPLLLFVLLGLIVGGTCVFRYEQVAGQSREAARWASVRGGDYEKDTDRTPPTRQEIFDRVIEPMRCGMDSTALSLRVQWVDKANGEVREWDDAPKDVRSITLDGEYTTNAVRVTVTYRWVDSGFFGPLTLQSASELPMAY